MKKTLKVYTNEKLIAGYETERNILFAIGRSKTNNEESYNLESQN